MSELEPITKKNTFTIIFMVVLSVICALILSIIASALSHPQAKAKEVDRSEQMMIAAKILSHNGYFIIKDKSGKEIPAKYSDGILVPGNANDIPSSTEILKIFDKRIIPLLVNDKGELTTFEKANINKNEYISKFQKSGFYNLPLKLIYKILPNKKIEKNFDPLKEKTEGWVIPVNGWGLWDAIYGYLALEPNGNDVIGITWYDQKETPGLGANITEEQWQKQFAGKVIFLEDPNGKTNFKNAPLGITVVKGNVSEVYGTSKKAKSAVDGMAGATLTGNGVTDAYKNSLAPYRPFFVKLNQDNKEANKGQNDTER